MNRSAKEKEAWHAISADKALSALETPPKGLSEDEAERRLRHYGLNELKESRRKTVLDVFVSQFRSLVVLILLGAAAMSLYIGEELNAIMKTTPLTPMDWLAIAAVSSTIFIAFEILKFAERRGLSVLS